MQLLRQCVIVLTVYEQQLTRGKVMQSRISLFSLVQTIYQDPIPRLRPVQSAFVNWADVDDHHAILDLDCDDGRLLNYYLHQYQVRACGIVGNIQDEKRTKSILGNKGEILRASKTDIPFMSASFDRVFIRQLSQHPSENKTIFDEIRRILKPNGRLLIVLECIPIIENISKLVGRIITTQSESVQLMALLESIGFNDISLRNSGLHYMTIVAQQARD